MSDGSPGPVALLRDLISVSEQLTSNPSGADLERLVMRRADLIRDLLFYRYYGFRAQLIEELVGFDPGVKAMWEKIVQEEQQADVLARRFRQGAAGSTDDKRVDTTRPRWSFQPDDEEGD